MYRAENTCFLGSSPQGGNQKLAESDPAREGRLQIFGCSLPKSNHKISPPLEQPPCVFRVLWYGTVCTMLGTKRVFVDRGWHHPVAPSGGLIGIMIPDTLYTFLFLSVIHRHPHKVRGVLCSTKQLFVNRGWHDNNPGKRDLEA